MGLNNDIKRLIYKIKWNNKTMQNIKRYNDEFELKEDSLLYKPMNLLCNYRQLTIDGFPHAYKHIYIIGGFKQVAKLPKKY